MNALAPMLTSHRDGTGDATPKSGRDAALSDADAIFQTATAFTKFAEAHCKTGSKASLERLRLLRSQIVETLLAMSQPLEAMLAPVINAVATACFESRLRCYPRALQEEELFSHCLRAVNSAPPGEGALRWLAAVMMARHAFELPSLPTLADIPQDIRPSWLSFLLESPPAFIRNGDADNFVQHLQRVCDQLRQHLRSTVGPAEDVAAAFLSSQAFVQSYFNESDLRELMTARAAIIEDILARRGAILDQLRVMRPCQTRPRIGIIVYGANDGTETIALAASLERLDRRRFDIRLYSLLEPSGKMGTRCRASVESYLRLPGSIPAAVTQLRGEDLDIAFFCTNMTAVAHPLTQIAAHRVAPIQAASLASLTTTGLRNMDLMVSGTRNETENSPTHYAERLICMDGVSGCYPLHYALEGFTSPDTISRSTHGIPDDAVLFFSAANFYKTIPELSEQWFRILSQVPNSHLMLMPYNPNWASSYPELAFNIRLQSQGVAAGVTLDRVHIHSPVPTIAHLHRIMEMADIYLDAFPFSGACSLADALVVGLPIVTRDGSVFRSRQSRAMLEEVGLGDWVCADNMLYVNRAIELARDVGLRARERERIDGIRGAGFKLLDTAPYAVMQMNTYDRIVADWNARVEALHTLDAGTLAQRISALASQKSRRGGVFTDRDLVLQIVLPYLRNGGTRRLIEVGAFTGGMSTPFLKEGWQAVLFEADERCHKPLAALVEAHRGRAFLEKVAVTPDHDGSIPFHLAEIPGLSGLTCSPFVSDTQTVDVRSMALARYIAAKGLFDLDFINIDAAGHDFAILNSIDFQKVTPRLVMVGFAEEYTGEDRPSMEAALRSMRARGYRACVVCLQTFGPFKRHDWPKGLLAIGIDAVPQLPAESPAFGNVLFFREDDRDFLPSLCDWLEQPLDWDRRGLTRA